MRARAERRRDPRVATQLPLILNNGAGTIEARTENISTAGACCTLKQFLAPMTKLQIRLELPGHSPSTVVSCRGVVVRVQPQTPRAKQSAYNIAIFFNDLSDHSRTVLARYVQERLPVAAPR